MNSIVFGLSEIFLLCFGVLIGITLGAMIFVKRKRVLILNHINYRKMILPKAEMKLVETKINDIYTYHINVRKNKIKLLFGLVKINRKVDYDALAKKYLKLNEPTSKAMSIPKELWWLVNDTAKIYYPESKYPLYELSIDEIFLLLREIVNLTEQIINDLGIPNLNKIKISMLNDLVKTTGKIKRIYNLKGIQITIGCFNAAIKLQSILTPIYWIKTGTNMIAVNSLSQFMAKLMFELVAKETAQIYSKNFVNK